MEIDPPQLVQILPGHAGGTTSVSVSPDGKTLVSGGYDSAFRVWDIATGQETHFLPGNRRGHVGFWPHRDLLIAGGLWGDTKLYDTTNWQVTETIDYFGGLWWLAFSPDGTTLATVHADEPVLLWDTSTWQVTGKIGAPAQCCSVAFIPYTNTLAVAFSQSQIAVSEMGSGSQVGAVQAEHQHLHCLTVSADGRVAASGGDKNALLWELPSWTSAATFAHQSSVISATFSPDNRYLVTGTLDGTISFWQLT